MERVKHTVMSAFWKTRGLEGSEVAAILAAFVFLAFVGYRFLGNELINFLQRVAGTFFNMSP
jgi:hypothetical protein